MTGTGFIFAIIISYIVIGIIIAAATTSDHHTDETERDFYIGSTIMGWPIIMIWSLGKLIGKLLSRNK